MRAYHIVWGEWRQEQYETINKENHILKGNRKKTKEAMVSVTSESKDTIKMTEIFEKGAGLAKERKGRKTPL